MLDRIGLCRMFPPRKRTLHCKIPDLYDHLQRCPLCPQDVKEKLAHLRANTNTDTGSRSREKEFYERIWIRLGHDGASD